MFLHLPSSDVVNKDLVPSSKRKYDPDPTEISYVVYGVRLCILYLFTFGVVIAKIRLPAFFSSMRKLVRLLLPGIILGSCQDTVAL